MDPRITLDRSFPTAVRRGGRRLAAAAAGAALVVTMGALPAQAEPAGTTAEAGTTGTQTHGIPWTEEHGAPIGYILPRDNPHFVFRTYYGFSEEDVDVTVAPADEAGQETGDEVDVDFTWREEIDGGVVNGEDARTALGDKASGIVLLKVYAGGVRVGSVLMGPDEDLTDGEVQILDLGAAARERLGDAPLTWTTKVWMTPGLEGFETGWIYDASEAEAQVTVVQEPAHGKVEVGSEASGFEGYARLKVKYYPEAGYTAGDTFTLRYEAEGKVREETFQVGWDGELVEELFVGDLVYPFVLGAGAIVSDAENPFPGEGDEPEQPADPVPAAPEPQEPAEPGTGEDDVDEEHTVPDKVDTGGSPDLLLGATAAFGAAALIGMTLLGRRRSAER